MPRKPLIRSSEHFYHITARSNNKEWFYIPSNDVWIYARKLLIEGRARFGIQVQAFVLMSNHYHMLILTPNANLDKFMQYFNRSLGRSIARHAGRINRIFGASYKWNLIISESYYRNLLRYIYQNPLCAGLVTRCEEYPYSDLTEKNICPDLLKWFNQAMSESECKHTKRRLREVIIDTLS
jgi:putative transposase